MSDTKVEVVKIGLCFYKGKIAEIDYGCGEYHYFELHNRNYLGGRDIYSKKRIGMMFRPIRVEKSYQEKLMDKIAKLERQLKEAQEKIERMKNCLNCAHEGSVCNQISSCLSCAGWEAINEK